MEKLKFKITDNLRREIREEANLLWPGHGVIAVRRLVRDSLRRLWRYCGDSGIRDRDG